MCVRYCVKSIPRVNSFSPHLRSVGEFCYWLHFADAEAEAWRGATCLRSPSWEAAEPTFEHEHHGSKSPLPPVCYWAYCCPEEGGAWVIWGMHP